MITSHSSSSRRSLVAQRRMDTQGGGRLPGKEKKREATLVRCAPGEAAAMVDSDRSGYSLSGCRAL